MVSIVLNFLTRFRQTAPYKETRYEYSPHHLTEKSDELIIAMALIYHYLANEYSVQDDYGQFIRSMTHEEIYDWFLSMEMTEFFNDSQIAFFKENEELFKEYLGKKA